MALNLPLLALYTLSVGSKRKREADQARAKARADSKVTNWVMGATGIRALGDNENLKDGDAKYGFSIGNSKTINQFPKEEAEFFDLFENPYDKNSPPITKKEFDILVYLARNKNRVVTKDSIAEYLWGDYMDDAFSYDFIYAHVKNLRKKLVQNDCGDYLKTVYGVGYKFISN